MKNDPTGKMLLTAIRKGDPTALFAFADYLEEQADEAGLKKWCRLVEKCDHVIVLKDSRNWDGDVVAYFQAYFTEYFTALSRLYKLGWKLGQTRRWSYTAQRKRDRFSAPFVAAMIKHLRERRAAATNN